MAPTRSQVFQLNYYSKPSARTATLALLLTSNLLAGCVTQHSQQQAERVGSSASSETTAEAATGTNDSSSTTTTKNELRAELPAEQQATNRNSDYRSLAERYTRLYATETSQVRQSGLMLRAALAWHLANETQQQAKSLAASNFRFLNRKEQKLHQQLSDVNWQPSPAEQQALALQFLNLSILNDSAISVSTVQPGQIANYKYHREAIGKPGKVALLLPLSGRFATAGQAVKRGIDDMLSSGTAYFNLLSIDTANYDSFYAAYASAMNAGANLIVGPLEKDRLAEALEQENIAIPILALNESNRPDKNHPKIYQFGYLPEDEIHAASKLMLESGQKRVALLVPEGELGVRAIQAFERQLTRFGGQVTASQTYTPGSNNLKEAVGKLLATNSSRPLWRDIRETDEEQQEGGQFFGRQARDQLIDAVFILGVPRDVHIIRPLLLFQHAVDLPSYSTGLAIDSTGGLDVSDLRGLYLCASPALLTALNPQPQATAETVTAKGEESLNNAKPASLPDRLRSIGRDAVMLINELDSIASKPGETVQGDTGELSLRNDNRIRRRVNCQKIEQRYRLPSGDRRYGS